MMNKNHPGKLLIYIAGLFIAAAVESYAATDIVSVEVSLGEARDIAVTGNGEVRAARANLRAAEERVRAVWGQLLPVIESEVSATRQGADSGIMSLSDGQYDIRMVQLRFGINPGGFYHTLEQSHAALKTAREESRRIIASVEYSVIKSYYDVVLTDEMVRLKTESRKVLEENLRDVENLYLSGSVPRFELLQAQVRLQNLYPEIREAETNYSLAVDTFNLALGSGDRGYSVRGDEINGKDIFPVKEDDVVPEITAMAMRNRPEIISIEHMREGARQGAAVHESSYLWPVFSVAGSYGLSYNLANPSTITTPLGPMEMNTVTGNREWQDTWQVRVAATYRWSSLIPADTGRARAREEDERKKEIDEKLADMKRSTAIAVRSHYGRLRAAYDSIISQKKNIETADEGLRIARESYRAGVIRNADLLGAELSLTLARTGYIKALYDYNISTAALCRESGADVTAILFREK